MKLIFTVIYQDNFDRFKLFVDNLGWYENCVYLVYKMAVYHGNKKMINYIKYYIDNKKFKTDLFEDKLYDIAKLKLKNIGTQ